MSETRILIRLLRMYFPRNSEFGSALSKLRNFGGMGLNPPTPPRYATDGTGCVIGEFWTISSVYRSCLYVKSYASETNLLLASHLKFWTILPIFTKLRLIYQRKTTQIHIFLFTANKNQYMAEKNIFMRRKQHWLHLLLVPEFMYDQTFWKYKLVA
jgi:hypothetical protein